MAQQENIGNQNTYEAALVNHEGAGDVTVTNYGIINIVAGGDVSNAKRPKYDAILPANLGGLQNASIQDTPTRIAESGHRQNTAAEAISRSKQARQTTFTTEKMSDQEEECVQLCNIVNKATVETVSVKVTEHYKDVGLCEPDHKVYPQMRKIADFFRGGYQELMQEDANCYFATKNMMNLEEESISKDDILKSITGKMALKPGDKNPLTAVVASAGSGKSTLLRQLAKDALDSWGLFSDDGEVVADKSDPKMVYFKEIKDMKHEKCVKPSQFLFGGMFSGKADEDKTYEWVLNHQSEVILFFDGLDQATWSITNLTLF